MEAVLVAALNSIALLILGIQYAILLGVMGALWNVIPYIGGVVAVPLARLLAVASKQPMDASKVKINARVSMMGVLVGNALWGVFLSTPITAIAKAIFDPNGPLKAFGFLLGDNQPDITQEIFVVRRRTRSASATK